MIKKLFFESHAPKWDNFTKEDTPERISNELIPLFDIKENESILDAGCGTGILLPFLRQSAGEKARITALDYSVSMINEARKKYGDGYEYISGDAHNIKLPDESFDIVICFCAFPHFDDKKKVLGEFNRVLKPKGRLVIAHLASRKRINDYHKNIGHSVSNDTIPGNQLMLKLLAESGFREASIIEKGNFYASKSIKNQIE